MLFYPAQMGATLVAKGIGTAGTTLGTKTTGTSSTSTTLVAKGTIFATALSPPTTLQTNKSPIAFTPTAPPPAVAPPVRGTAAPPGTLPRAVSGTSILPPPAPPVAPAGAPFTAGRPAALPVLARVGTAIGSRGTSTDILTATLLRPPGTPAGAPGPVVVTSPLPTPPDPFVLPPPVQCPPGQAPCPPGARCQCLPVGETPDPAPGLAAALRDLLGPAGAPPPPASDVLAPGGGLPNLGPTGPGGGGGFLSVTDAAPPAEEKILGLVTAKQALVGGAIIAGVWWLSRGSRTRGSAQGGAR
jgi:hypothetical protein